jgi:hypothetical protein
MSYLNERTTRKGGGTAELMCLLLVLCAGVATAWVAGQKIGMDLGGLSAAASILGLTDTGREAHGAVGYNPNALPAEATTELLAPYCNPGERPRFALGMAALKERLGDTMGMPLECEHPATSAGDTVQQTTMGLAAYSQTTNTVSFTDGWRHWAITPRGLVNWEGTSSEPPA